MIFRKTSTLANSKTLGRKPLITLPSTAKCYEAVELMTRHQVHHLAIVKDGEPIGILNDRDIFYRWVRSSHLTLGDFNNQPIEPIIRTHLPAIQPNTTLSEALTWMDEYGTSGLLSKDEQGKWEITTESDLLSALHQLISRSGWPDQLLAKTESKLASPVVQKLIEMATQMGL